MDLCRVWPAAGLIFFSVQCKVHFSSPGCNYIHKGHLRTIFKSIYLCLVICFIDSCHVLDDLRLEFTYFFAEPWNLELFNLMCLNLRRGICQSEIEELGQNIFRCKSVRACIQWSLDLGSYKLCAVPASYLLIPQMEFSQQFDLNYYSFCARCFCRICSIDLISPIWLPLFQAFVNNLI